MSALTAHLRPRTEPFTDEEVVEVKRPPSATSSRCRASFMWPITSQSVPRQIGPRDPSKSPDSTPGVQPEFVYQTW